MCQDHKSVFLDDEAGVGKALVQFAAVVIENAAEADGYISKCDNNVATDVGVF